MNKQKNTYTRPLNREGALELGLCPCKICEVGWSTYGGDKDGNVDIKHCQDTCDCFKRYMEKEKIEIILK